MSHNIEIFINTALRTSNIASISQFYPTTRIGLHCKRSKQWGKEHTFSLITLRRPEFFSPSPSQGYYEQFCTIRVVISLACTVFTDTSLSCQIGDLHNIAKECDCVNCTPSLITRISRPFFPSFFTFLLFFSLHFFFPVSNLFLFSVLSSSYHFRCSSLFLFWDYLPP